MKTLFVLSGIGIGCFILGSLTTFLANKFINFNKKKIVVDQTTLENENETKNENENETKSEIETETETIQDENPKPIEVRVIEPQ